MKKRIFSMILCLSMVFSIVQLKPMQTNAKEISNLSNREIVAYKTIIESYIKIFGIADVEYDNGTIIPTEKNGVGLVEFVDFDKNGSLEMIVGYNYDHIYRCAVYSYTPNGAECLYSDICTLMMGNMMELYLYENNTNIYTIVDYCLYSENDRTTIGTLVNGKWVITNYTENQGNLPDDIFQNRKAIYYTKDNNPQTILETLNNTIAKDSHLVDKVEYVDQIRYSYIAQLHFLQAKLNPYGDLTNDNIYYIYDINKDNVPELILKQGTCEADYIYKVFSYANENTTYLGDLPGGHISLYGVVEPEILLSYAHHGYERIYQSQIENEKLCTPDMIYEEDSTKKEYTYVDNMDSFRKGAYYLESSTIFNLSLLNKYFLDQKETPTIYVTINGKIIAFDQTPIVVDNRTLVPLRAIFEELGATVDWDDNTQTVTSTKGKTTISMSIGKTEMYKNGQMITLDVVPQLIGGRTLVPVRAVAEGFDCKVDWDENTQTVIIKTINTETIINAAKNLYQVNENMGGVTNLATYAEVDTLLYNTLNEIDKTLAVNEFILDMVSAGTTATIAAAKISTGNYTSIDNLGDGLSKLLSSEEIADAANGVLKDAIKQRVFNEISTYVSDANALILNMGRSAYDDNSKMILDLITVHSKFKKGNYTYDDALAYIVLYDTLTMNRKTMSMAVEVLCDELPQNFMESLLMSAETSAKSILGNLFGEIFGGKRISISTELLADIISAYTDYACGQSTDLFKYMKQINHPAITEWANEFEIYNNNIKTTLTTN